MKTMDNYGYKYKDLRQVVSASCDWPSSNCFFDHLGLVLKMHAFFAPVKGWVDPHRTRCCAWLNTLKKKLGTYRLLQVKSLKHTSEFSMMIHAFVTSNTAHQISFAKQKRSKHGWKAMKGLRPPVVVGTCTKDFQRRKAGHRLRGPLVN